MIVVDASALVELLLARPGARTVERQLRGVGASLHAPDLLLLEATQTIRRYEQRNDIDGERAAVAVVDLLALGVTTYEHEILLPRIWQLRHNLTAYDAAYVALAEVLDAPLVTFDAHLAAAPGHDAVIELLTAA